MTMSIGSPVDLHIKIFKMKKYSQSRILRCLLLLTLISFSSCLQTSVPKEATIDPRVITYPGDLNFALIIDGHESMVQKTSSPTVPPSSSFSSLNVNQTAWPLECSSKINSDGVLKGMSAIWAAHQVNIRKGRGDNSLRIGVSVYDACSSRQVIQRQTLRLLASSLFNANTSPVSSSSSTSAGNVLSIKSCRENLKGQPIIFGKYRFLHFLFFTFSKEINKNNSINSHRTVEGNARKHFLVPIVLSPMTPVVIFSWRFFNKREVPLTKSSASFDCVQS